MLLSVVIPVYKSQLRLRNLVETLQRELRSVMMEIVLVNDGSPDGTEGVGNALARTFPNVQFISLRKNFGEFAAVLCGIRHARGDYVVMIDDDFQCPPSEIIKLLSHARDNHLDVVFSRYDLKQHHWFRNLGSWGLNKLQTWLLHKPNDLYLSSFMLMSRDIARLVGQYQGLYPYPNSLVFRYTDRVGSVLVEHHARTEGKSNYTLKKLLRLTWNILLGYSLLPLRLLLGLGLGLLCMGTLSLIAHFFEWYRPGMGTWLTLMAGLQFTGLGLVGEYIGRLFLSQTNMPQYVIKYKLPADDRTQ